MNRAHKGDIKWFRTKQLGGLEKGGGLNAQGVGSRDECRNTIQDLGYSFSSVDKITNT